MFACSKAILLSFERRSLRRVGELHERSEKIGRMTVANQLDGDGEPQACEGLSYLVSPDETIPWPPNTEAGSRGDREP